MLPISRWPRRSSQAREREARMTIRIGNGFDVHALVAGRRLVLGGVTIAHAARTRRALRCRRAAARRSADALLGALARGRSRRAFSRHRPAVEGRRQPRAAAPRRRAGARARFAHRQRRHDGDRAGAEAGAARAGDAREHRSGSRVRRRRRSASRRRPPSAWASLAASEGIAARCATVPPRPRRRPLAARVGPGAARRSSRRASCGSVTRASVPPPSRGSEVEAAAMHAGRCARRSPGRAPRRRRRRVAARRRCRA